MASAVFADLKWQGVNCELSHEFAKDKVWEGSEHILGNQVYILGKQYHRLWRLKDKVDVIICDSPLLAMIEYGSHMSDTYKEFLHELYLEFDNLDVFLERTKDYNPAGRIQTLAEAQRLDWAFKSTVMDLCYDYLYEFKAWPSTAKIITELVMERLHNG